MTKFQHRLFIAILIALLAASSLLGTASAASRSPAQAAESIRASLVNAQLSLPSDPSASAILVQDAKATYQTELSGSIAASNPDAHLRVISAFEDLAESVTHGDTVSFAAARAQAWTGILAGSYTIVENAVQSGDGATAQTWLPVREFRVATRFSRPNVGATLAVEGFVEGTISAEEALQSVRADVLDTYQARMIEALRDLSTADANGFAIRRAELAALAEGYFFTLSPAYLEQRGEVSLANAQKAFDDLRVAAIDQPQPLAGTTRSRILRDKHW